MADETNGRSITLTSGIQIGALVALLTGVSALYQILHNENVALETRMREADDRLQREIDQHITLEGHPGILAKAASLVSSLDTERAERQGAFSQNRSRLDADEARQIVDESHIIDLMKLTEDLRACTTTRRER